MLHSRFFLIEPLSWTSAELAQMLKDDELMLWCTPQLMSHEFGDRSGWSTADICLVVKLAFLAEALDIFQDDGERAQIFGSADISEIVFDRWWSIRQIEYLGRTIEFSQELRSFSENLRPGDSMVAKRWLQQMIAD